MVFLPFAVWLCRRQWLSFPRRDSGLSSLAPRAGRGEHTISFSRRVCAPELWQTEFLPDKAGRRSAERRTLEAASSGCSRARIAARSPSGAPPRHSPRQSQPALAQPRAGFPETRLGRASARIRLSQSNALRVDRSLCRPTGVQGRPGAGLQIPPAGTALAPSDGCHR